MDKMIPDTLMINALTDYLNGNEIIAATLNHPIVGQGGAGAGGVFGSFLLFMGLAFVAWNVYTFSIQQIGTGYVFNLYMILSAADTYGWVEPNIVDVIVKYIFNTIDASIFISILLWPFKEIIGVFLYLEDEKHFSPMNEFQAYFFMLIMYPFIWFYAEIFDWYHLAVSVVMLFWLIVDPNLLIQGTREDGTGIPRDNYASIYA